MVVYSLTALLCLTGIVVAIGFAEPCPPRTLTSMEVCRPTFDKRLPAPSTWFGMGVVMLAMVVAFELRWWVRSVGVGAIGLVQIFTGIASVSAGHGKVVVVAQLLLGIALIAAARATHRDSRVGWSFAAAMCGTLTLVFFFGASTVRSATGWAMGWAVLPALAIYLPTTVALALTAPGKPRYAPFANRPISG
jgi:hypothetical protein